MTHYRHTGPIWLALLLAGLLIVAVPRLAGANTARTTNGADLQQAWSQFLADDATREPVLRFPYEQCFRRAAAAHDVPVSLLLAVARGESDFDPRAISSANAHGLMQILWPDTARHLGLYRLSELYDPCRNVEAGTRYLKELLARYDGNLHLALAAYNYGPQRIAQDGSSIPSGAEWYSGYIYRHLGYVLGERAGEIDHNDVRDYLEEGQLQLVMFSTPYRAEAFVTTLQARAPTLRLDWFKHDVGEFRVMLLYDNAADLRRGKSLLRNAGFVIR